MTWATPTTEQIRSLRLRDGPNFVIPPEYLAHLIINEDNVIYFPIYAIDGSLAGWNGRAPEQKIWSQTITNDVAPRFTSWTPQLSQIVYASRKIFLVEGAYDLLAIAPIVPWVISTNTARVQKEILEWCKMWKLHVFTAFDLDLPDPKTQKTAGQDATQRVSRELIEAGCKVSRISWPNMLPAKIIVAANGIPTPITGLPAKDPAQAYAAMGRDFHVLIHKKVTSACLAPTSKESIYV